jgi:hypothetical protein
MRSGAIFVMDVAVHNVPAEDGELMFAVSRDVKTGYFDGFAMTLKTEMTEELSEVMVVAHDPSNYGPQPFGKQRTSAMWSPAGDTYTTNSGIWQSVRAGSTPRLPGPPPLHAPPAVSTAGAARDVAPHSNTHPHTRRMTTTVTMTVTGQCVCVGEVN